MATDERIGERDVDIDFYTSLTDEEIYGEDADINIYAEETERI